MVEKCSSSTWWRIVVEKVRKVIVVEKLFAWSLSISYVSFNYLIEGDCIPNLLTPMCGPTVLCMSILALSARIHMVVLVSAYIHPNRSD